MTNSKRKRKAIFTRIFTLDELGIEPPEHIKNLKNPQRHFCLLDFNNEVGKLFSTVSEISTLVGNPINHEELNKQEVIFYEQIFIA